MPRLQTSSLKCKQTPQCKNIILNDCSHSTHFAYKLSYTQLQQYPAHESVCHALVFADNVTVVFLNIFLEVGEGTRLKLYFKINW